MALDKFDDGAVQAITVSILVGAVLGASIGLAVQPRLLHSPNIFAAVTALGGAIGAGIFFFMRKRWPVMRNPSLPFGVTFSTGAVLLYVAITLVYLRSASSDQLLNASLLGACLVFYLSWIEKPYIAVAAGLTLTISAVLCVAISKNFFAIPFAIAGVVGAWFHLRLIVRGESD